MRIINLLRYITKRVEYSWCGLGLDYCLSPDCQLNYGSGCDGNQKPDGVDTSDIERPKIGDVPYGGAGIYDCEIDGDIALTFDDGPYEYTEDLLDLLAVCDSLSDFFTCHYSYFHMKGLS